MRTSSRVLTVLLLEHVTHKKSEMLCVESTRRCFARYSAASKTAASSLTSIIVLLLYPKSSSKQTQISFYPRTTCRSLRARTRDGVPYSIEIGGRQAFPGATTSNCTYPLGFAFLVLSPAMQTHAADKMITFLITNLNLAMCCTRGVVQYLFQGGC